MSSDTLISDFYGETYLTAKTVIERNLQGQYTIKEVKPVEFQRDEKVTKKLSLVLEGLVGEAVILNRTNAKRLAEKFGPDFSTWKGKKIELSIQKVSFMGKPVDSILITPVD